MRSRKIIISLAGLMLTATVLYAAGKFLTVQVRKTRLRSAPDFFMSKTVAELTFGQRVEVLQTKGTWARVRLANGQQGWVSSSSLTAKHVKLSAGGKDARVKAGEEELALAGRGFSHAVEKNYRQNNRRLNYAWVDRMQEDPAFKVSLDQMREFLVQGGLLAAPANADGGL